jgi:hypothetical protein
LKILLTFSPLPSDGCDDLLNTSGKRRKQACPSFTVDPDDNITALVEVRADADRSTTFSTEKELAKLVSECPILPLIVLPALHAVPGAEADEKDRGLEIRSVQFAAAFTIRITGNFAPLTSATSIRSMAR